MKFTPLSVVIALAIVVVLASAGTALYAATGVHPSAADGVRHNLNDVQRDRVRYGKQPLQDELNEMFRQRALKEQKAPEIFEESYGEFTVKELVERCMALGFERSRLSTCLGNASKGIWFDVHQY
ncbi:hypothetical protein A2635_01730 [Candidatus Peribacteria bacterium RIFCSPHIGHO2_01_FULL_51_9]|nr:MAG: hypothetical protein A2635_01730 [Candidatus Peribacteria bacterium RIFCSPHIGHO2_01_FULL_51_9]